MLCADEEVSKFRDNFAEVAAQRRFIFRWDVSGIFHVDTTSTNYDCFSCSKLQASRY